MLPLLAPIVPQLGWVDISSAPLLEHSVKNGVSRMSDGEHAVESTLAAKTGSFAALRKWLSRSADDAPVVTIEPGALFGHMSSGRSVELARIIDVATDEFGIRHVRFHLGYRYQHKIMEAGERTLAMPSFTARFTRRLDS